MSVAHKYVFPSIRGVQAGREYYVSMCPLRLIPRLFLFDEEELGLQPESRAQRVLNKARIPALADYIINNPSEYVFSALTASIDADVSFVPISNAEDHFNVGFLEVPMSARFIINDGQHRRAAVEAALKQKPSLGDESIAIVFFVDTGLHRSQQMFADLNRYAVRPTQSLNILYDYRDPLSQVARELSQRVQVFAGMTETEKSTISNRSTRVFTLSGIHRGTTELLARQSDLPYAEQLRLAIQFWNAVSRYIPEWQQVRQGRLAPVDFRKDYICAHTVALVALGRAGSSLMDRFPTEWTDELENLRQLNWHRANTGVWEGRATVGGRIANSRHNLTLITAVIKRALNVPLSSEEQKAEDAVHPMAKGSSA